MSSSQNFQPTSKSAPCMICGNVSGHCKSTIGDRGDTLHYCHNHAVNPGGPIDGHKFLKSVGQWGIFVLPNSEPRQTQPRSATQKPVSKSVPPVERDAAFRSFMSGKTCTLTIGRTFTDEESPMSRLQHEALSRSRAKNPAICAHASLLTVSLLGHNGACATPQRALDKWVNWIGGGTKNGDELPLTCHRPIGVTPSGIAICEGIGAKSFILAERSGMVAIGAGAAGQFGGSPNHWREYLASIASELKTTALHFYPDAGALQNPRVIRSYRQWFKLVAETGYTVKVASWEGFEHKTGGDLDRITVEDFAKIEFITVAEFEAMADPEVIPPRTLWKCLPSHLDQIGSWNFVDVPIDAVDLIDHHHDLTSRDPNYKYIGPCTVKKEDVERFSEFQPKANFDLKFSKMLEDPTGGGILFGVTWFDRSVRTRRALVKTAETLTTADFMKSLTRALGGHFTSTLKINELAAIIENRKGQYLRDGGKVYRLAPRTGRQEDGFWVFECVQFNPQGHVCTEEESLWIFNPNLGIDEQVVSPKIAPQDDSSIANLVSAAASYYSSDTLPLALMTLGYGAATVHRDHIFDFYGSFPQMNTFGDPGGGKTLAATMACSLFGTHLAPVTSFSESVMYETVKSVGSLLLLVDDPLKKERRGGDLAAKVDSFVWNMYGAAARKVRGNEQKPHTNVVITSNKAVGEGTQAIESRLIKISFPVKPFNEFGRQSLSDAMRSASGGLGQLIGLKFDLPAIRETALKLTPHLKGAHARLTDNYAILTHYTRNDYAIWRDTSLTLWRTASSIYAPLLMPLKAIRTL